MYRIIRNGHEPIIDVDQLEAIKPAIGSSEPAREQQQNRKLEQIGIRRVFPGLRGRNQPVLPRIALELDV
jgi:hypothetical protein